MLPPTSYLCTSETLESFPLSFCLPAEKCFRQHGSLGQMRVPWISYMEGTVKRLRKNIFIVISYPHSFPCHARREGEVAQLCLHSKGTVTCPGGSTSRGTARVGPVVMSFLCPSFHHLGKGAFLELVDIVLQLCLGSTLGSLSLWGCKGSYLVLCFISFMKSGNGLG